MVTPTIVARTADFGGIAPLIALHVKDMNVMNAQQRRALADQLTHASGQALIAAELTAAEVLRKDAERLDRESNGFPLVACLGIPRVGCDYLTACNSVCNKCGQVHHHHQMVANFPRTERRKIAELKPEFRPDGNGDRN